MIYVISYLIHPDEVHSLLSVDLINDCNDGVVVCVRNGVLVIPVETLVPGVQLLINQGQTVVHPVAAEESLVDWDLPDALVQHGDCGYILPTSVESELLDGITLQPEQVNARLEQFLAPLYWVGVVAVSSGCVVDQTQLVLLQVLDECLQIHELGKLKELLVLLKHVCNVRWDIPLKVLLKYILLRI